MQQLGPGRDVQAGGHGGEAGGQLRSNLSGQRQRSGRRECGTGASGMNFISMQVRRRGTREYFALEK